MIFVLAEKGEKTDMVKVFCDMCKRPIDYEIDGVNLNFSHFGVVKFSHEWKQEKQLCVPCAVRVCNWIEHQCEQSACGERREGE